MVAPLVVLALAGLGSAAPEPLEPLEAPMAVIRVARGEVRVGRGSTAAISGRLLAVDDTVAVKAGWAELMIGAHLRVRLAAQTRLGLQGPTRLRLPRGRAWLELGRRAEPVDVEVSGRAVRLRPGASVVIDRSAGGSVSVFAGAAELPGRTERIVVAGRTADLSAEDGDLRGGEQALAAARREARAGLGDLAGWRAFLLSATRSVELAAPPPIGAEGMVDPRGVHGLGSSAGLLVEEALRPPPFFPAEVPPTGPNVRVRIGFDDG